MIYYKHYIKLILSAILTLMDKAIDFVVLDKTLKDIRGVRLGNRKILRAPDPRTKYS